MMRLVSSLALGAVATVGAVETVAAQRPHRSGLWFEAGWGFASIRVACTGCEDVTRASGSGAAFRLGGVISDKVLFGVETFTYLNESFGLSDTDPDLVARTSNFGAVVLWWPWKGGFFLKGGVGMANGEFTLDAETDDEVVFDGTGVGLTFGIGLDVPVKRWLALSFNAGAYVTAIGDLVTPTVRIEDVIPSMYTVTLGFTIR
jgi:hypothetical protein